MASRRRSSAFGVDRPGHSGARTARTAQAAREVADEPGARRRADGGAGGGWASCRRVPRRIWHRVAVGLARAARRSRPARIADAGAGRRRRRVGSRKGARGAVARHRCQALHRVQASQSPRPCARAPARGNLERLPRHDLRRDARRGRDPAQGVHPQMAAQMPRRRRQPGGSRRQAVHISRGSRRANGNRSEPRTRSSDCTRSSSAGSKLQTVLLCAKTAAMLFWALLASGQIITRNVDGWQTLAEKPEDQIIDLAA